MARPTLMARLYRPAGASRSAETIDRKPGEFGGSRIDV
jgi:hypothetical protein